MNEWICEEVPAVTMDGKVVSTMLHKEQELVRCKDCLFGESCKNGRGEHGIMCYNSQSANKDWVHEPDWYCADGELR